MGEAGFERIRKSVTSRQNTVAQYIVMRPIMDLCGQSTRRPGVRVSWWWWDQAGMNLGGAKKRVSEEATVLESDLESDLGADLVGEEESSGASGSNVLEWRGAEERPP